MSDGAQPAPPRRRRGGQPFVPTEDERFLVTVLHRHGISHSVISKYVNRANGGIDQKTLRKAFRRELNEAVERVKANMIAALVRSAMNGNVSAQRYWLARFGGPEWQVPDPPDPDDPDIPPGTVPAGAIEEAGGGIVVTIIGGLPQRPNGSPPTLEAQAEPGDSTEEHSPGETTNGAGSTD